MHNNVVLGSLIIILAGCSSSKRITAETEDKLSGAYASNIVVDGKADDWKSIPGTTSPKGTIQYAVANDDHDIYVFMRIPDQAEQMKLLRGGMQLYVDPSLNKKKATEVIYPVKDELSPGEGSIRQAGGERPDKGAMHHQIISQLISLNRAGFKPEYNGVQSIRENTGFKAAINWDENDDLVYELVIPRAAFKENIKGNDMELGFYLTGLERPSNTAGGGGNWKGGGEMNGGGMGMGHRSGGFGGNGGRYGNRQGQRSGINSTEGRKNLYSDEHFWVEYKIVNSQ